MAEAPLLMISTVAYDEIAAKLRKLDRFDLIDTERDILQFGDVALMRLTPRSVPPTA